MPTGIPFVYRFDQKMQPKEPPEGSLTQAHTSGIFLEKPGLLKEALKRQEDWENLVEFESVDIDLHTKRVTTLEKALIKLREEQAVENFAAEFVDSESTVDDGTDGHMSVKVVNGSPAVASVSTVKWNDDPAEFEDYDEFADYDFDEVPANIVPLPAEDIIFSIGEPHEKKEAVVVFIRHGRTPHNNLGLFTGWEDPPLAAEGIEDAKNAGRLLKMHGFAFDVVYSSWLNRAITTAWYVMDELDCLWLPIVKSWRLNERMYGALTGKSKKMVANEYGEDQLKKWRRGFKIRPPPTSSFSLNYPGNDYRRTKYVKDLRISWTETITRSLEDRKLQFHRKFPKTESLSDCMDRSVRRFS